MGINSPFKIPRDIAKAVGLEAPEAYKGHAFRWSAVTHMAKDEASGYRTHSRLQKSLDPFVFATYCYVELL